MLELRRLRLLHELSVRGTIAEVADVLRYSPSSVSQQLSQLEAEAGVPLLRRTGRTLQLTPQGQVLAAHAERMLAAMEQAEAELAASQSSVAGTVKLAIFQTALLALAPGMLRSLRAEHPEVRVELSQQEPAAALQETSSRTFDLVVAEQYPGHAAPHYASLDRRVLTADALRLALPAAGALDSAVFDAASTLADAAALPWVMEPAGAASRHWAEQACRTAGFEPDVRYESADLQAHLSLVQSGHAVALLPDLVSAPASGLRLLELPGAPERTIFTAARHSSAPSPAVAAVREALHRQAAALIE